MRAFARAVKDHFVASWAATTVQHENVLFTPPTNDAWVRLNVVTGSGQQISLGPTSLDRETGYVQVTVFVPLTGGAEYRDHLIDTLKPIFRKRRVGGATFGVPDIVVNINDSEPWYMASVRWRYQLDEETHAVMS